MDLTRRHFLRQSGLGLAAAWSATWLDVGPARAAGGAPGAPLLVAIFLRGGADGLALVPPVGEGGYRSLRGELALSEALPFATGFGLHPELAAVAPLVERWQLAVVHAAGSPHPSRSHFEAQDFMEVGEPGTARAREGWLARALRGSAESAGPFASLALTGELPLTLRGSGAFAVADTAEFGIPTARPGARAALARIYAEAGADPVAEAGRRALAALAEYEARYRLGPAAAPRRQLRARSGRPQLAAGVDQLLAVERAGLPVRAVFLESASWDTHVRQGQGRGGGALASLARDLGEGLAKLDAGLRGRRDWIAVVMTEFGRTVRPNGSGGSDHGHGSVMLVAGPRVRGGLWGDWPGLAESALYEGRDLAVANDYRSVLSEVLRAHLGAPPPPETFPGYTPSRMGLFA